MSALLFFHLPLLLLLPLMIVGQTPKKSEVVNLDDSKLYYEVYGEGEPLFLLHGFFQSSKHWHPFVNDYAKEFELYLVDLTGHGKSSNFKDRVSIPEAAENLNALIQHLGLEKIKAIGFSYGGDVAFHLAAKYPKLMESMIAIGGLGTWDVHNYPDWIEYFSYQNITNLEWMRTHQPSEERIKWLLDHFDTYVVSLSEEMLANIQARTMIVLGGEDDSIPLTEVARVRDSVKSTSLWIIPDTPHSAHIGKNQNNFLKTSIDFLKRE